MKGRDDEEELLLGLVFLHEFHGTQRRFQEVEVIACLKIVSRLPVASCCKHATSELLCSGHTIQYPINPEGQFTQSLLVQSGEIRDGVVI